MKKAHPDHRVVFSGLAVFLLVQLASSSAIADVGCGASGNSVRSTASLGGDLAPILAAFDDADELDPAIHGRRHNPAPIRRLPRRKREFCGRTSEAILESMRWTPNPVNQNAVAMRNPMGDFNTGLCWLHTRFQRSAAYLANYRPKLPKPGRRAALRTIRRLIEGDRVVEVPGYRSLFEFTADYKDELEVALNDFALRTLPGMAARLGDTSEEDPEVLQERMNGLYRRMLVQPEAVFLRIFRPSFHALKSHSLMLIGMEPIRAPADSLNPLAALRVTGYRMRVVDSNLPRSDYDVIYRFGDTNVRPLSGESFNFHVAFDADLSAIRGALGKYCR